MAQQHSQQAAGATKELTGTDLLQELMARPVTERMGAVDRWLEGQVDKIRALLPPDLRSQAERFTRMAANHVRGNDKLHKCSPTSLIGCVLEAANLGFPLDGRLAYAVPYGTEAQCQFDYKAKLAYAKRTGLIRDGWSRIVMKQDHFSLTESNGVQSYEFVPDITVSRDTNLDDMLGVLTVVITPDGRTRFDWMTKSDVLNIRDKSKAYRYAVSCGKSDSTWHLHVGEMAKKTGTHRMMKTFTDDAGMLRIQAGDELDFEFDNSLPEDVPRSTHMPERSSRSEALAAKTKKPESKKPKGKTSASKEKAAEKKEAAPDKPSKKDATPPPEVPDSLAEFARMVHSVDDPADVQQLWVDHVESDAEDPEAFDAGTELRDWKLRQLGSLPHQKELL